MHIDGAALLLHRVAAEMDIVEGLHQPLHVRLALEAVHGHGNLHLPLLVDVAGLDKILAAEALDVAAAQLLLERVHARGDAGEGRADAVEVEGVGMRVAARAELGDDVGELPAAGAERTGRCAAAARGGSRGPGRWG